MRRCARISATLLTLRFTRRERLPPRGSLNAGQVRVSPILRFTRRPASRPENAKEPTTCSAGSPCFDSRGRDWSFAPSAHGYGYALGPLLCLRFTADIPPKKPVSTFERIDTSHGHSELSIFAPCKNVVLKYAAQCAESVPPVYFFPLRVRSPVI